MKRYLLILLFPSFCIAQNQKKDTVLRYLDEKLELTTRDSAVYYGVSVRRNDHWFLYALYSDTTPVASIYFKDKKLTIKDGAYTVFYPKNTKAIEGYFVENKKDSIWQNWHPNGNLKDSGFVKNNQLIGEWKTWYETGQLKIVCHYKDQIDPVIQHLLAIQSNQNIGIKNGAYESLYSNGIKESSGFFKDDLMEGEWRWYYESGHLSTIENYKSGKLTSLRCFDSTGKEEGDFCSIAKPATVKRVGDYREFIKENLTWPEEALKKKIEGIVKVKLSIDKYGKVKELELTSDQTILKKAVEELFNTMKEWYPAVSHNRPIEWKDEFDIPFYRNK
jgi:antitoxin component YwqK of YwqJK toxin-antitoxin module